MYLTDVLIFSSRQEVQNHTVRWDARFEFICKMSANASTGVLDPCAVRVSVRKELKGGRSFQKLGFSDLNLAEFAGSGRLVRRCLLEGYDARHRQDNSMLKVVIKMNMLSGDILFKVQNQIVSEEVGEKREDYSGGSIASGSSGFGSLPKKRPNIFSSVSELGTLLPSDSFAEAPSENFVMLEPIPTDETHEPGHSRNSSNTSQMSRASGYSSLNSQSQHSRQSSSGDSGHIRSPSWPVWAPRLPPLPSSTAPPSPVNPPAFRTRSHLQNKLRPCNGFHSSSTSSTLYKSSTAPCVPRPGQDEAPAAARLPPPLINPGKSFSSPGILHSPGIARRSHAAPDGTVASRNASTGSGPSETGSLDRAKAALDRRKKAEESGPCGRVEVTRVNPDSLIDELLRTTNLTQSDESSQSKSSRDGRIFHSGCPRSGLQLFIAKDGTTSLGSQDIKNQMPAGVFKQVVIEENR
ncbi:UNVERIFIED_CONTAM: hypothetical protein PYX00_003767 [Menopon gallinae]|uniref:C2 NT-type domain-containing protein n=1 Tax=Menopon gallinae TaxID=328185 RepID=A0AAW2I288_9NEOP